MFRKLNLLAFLMVILTLSSLAQASGPRGHRRGPSSKGVEARIHTKRHPLALKVKEVREAEANCSEIKPTINQMLKAFGVELLESRRGHKRGGFFSQLTEEQKLQIDSKVKEIREAGASRKEIRQKISAMLVELGIEVLAKSGKGRGLQQLSSKQKAMVKRLLAKRTSPSEIRQALTELAIIDLAVAAAPSRDSSAVKLRFTTLGQVKMNNLK